MVREPAGQCRCRLLDCFCPVFHIGRSEALLQSTWELDAEAVAEGIAAIHGGTASIIKYLEDGRCSFSSNLFENSIHLFTAGRKNQRLW